MEPEVKKPRLDLMKKKKRPNQEEEGKVEKEPPNSAWEEVHKLKHFHVLDEAEHSSDDEDSGSAPASEDEIPFDEVEAMLDEGLPDHYKGERKRKERPYDHQRKMVLEEKGINHFEVLPLGWLVVPHNSGMPLYLHKQSRVCTLSKPYFLGVGNVRRHEIPVSAIPCLHYRRALEEERKLDADQAELISKITMEEPRQDQGKRTQKNISNSQKTKEVNSSSTGTTENTAKVNRCPFFNEVPNISSAPDVAMKESSSQASNKIVTSEESAVRTRANHALMKKLVNSNAFSVDAVPTPLLANTRVETAQENWAKFHLKHEEVQDYCKTLFKFKCINVMRFKSWAERRKFNRTKKTLQHSTLPDETKLITFPVYTPVNCASDSTQQGVLGDNSKIVRKLCLMNPSGKSYICILQEYVQRALKTQPTYEFKELESSATPFSASVLINGMSHGVGYGTSKRLAKSSAAKIAMEILIPEMLEKIKPDEIHGMASRNNDVHLAFFDDIGIEDPRITDLCVKTMEPSPHNILQTCLDRNFRIGDREIKFNITALNNHRNQLTMTVGKHTASVVCQNKKDGKQKASQIILKALHPNITSWGSLLRLYGTRSVKSFKEKKHEERDITKLQSQAAINQPNYAILDKLKAEMVKLKEKDDLVKPIGTFVLPRGEDLPTYSGSNLDNVDF